MRMEPNMRTMRWKIKLRFKFTEGEVTIHLFRLIVRYDSLNVTKSHVANITRHKKRENMQNISTTMQQNKRLSSQNVRPVFGGALLKT